MISVCFLILSRPPPSTAHSDVRSSRPCCQRVTSPLCSVSFPESASGLTGHLDRCSVFGSLICAPLFTSPFLLHLGILCSPPSISSLKAWLTRSFLFSRVFNCTSALKGAAPGSSVEWPHSKHFLTDSNLPDARVYL